MSLQACQDSQESWQSVRADGVDHALAVSDPKTAGFKNVEMDWTQVKYMLASWMYQNEHRQEGH